MLHQSLTPQDASGLLSLIGIAALFAFIFFLIRRTNLKRLEHSKTNPASAARPYLQPLSASEPGTTANQEDIQAAHEAYDQWKTAYLLLGDDGRSEFLRGETYKRGLRYQITSTSLTQGLAMFIQTQMAQDGDNSRASFERLLAHLLAHPSQKQPALSSWLSMPDLPTSPRLDPDLHAEAWILAALVTAKAQWGGLERFDLEQILQERSTALIACLREDAENQQPIFSPLLFNLISRGAPDPLWQARTETDWRKLMPLLRKTDGLPDRRQALSLLQIGLEGLLDPQNGFAERRDLAFSRLKRVPLEGLPEDELEAGFSGLASLSCCVPLSLLASNQETAKRLSTLIREAQPAKQDSLGACLRLIALMSLTGTLWIE